MSVQGITQCSFCFLQKTPRSRVSWD